MSSFNLSSLRSSGPMSHQSTDKEHAIAHEVLLIALLTQLAKAENSNKVLIEIMQTVESMIGKSNPNSTRIATALINEAAEKLNK